MVLEFWHHQKKKWSDSYSWFTFMSSNNLRSVPAEMQPHFYQNIVLTGGNTLFPGFRERLEAELRSLVPAHLPMSVLLPARWVSNTQEHTVRFPDNNMFIVLSAVPSLSLGKEGSCWLTIRTMMRWWWRGTTTRRMDILFVKRSLTFDWTCRLTHCLTWSYTFGLFCWSQRMSGFHLLLWSKLWNEDV